eukprot:GHUV01023947.1.p1 GENE.GHUV01023947.1~~GHUV01023947.1.p1  ORF type:complete len:169 (-),score=61.36 GHUV01023947.1:991-1497(-)
MGDETAHMRAPAAIATHWPVCAGCQNTKLTPLLDGAPNFRQVEGLPVYGVAIPTVRGLRNVLEELGAAQGTATAACRSHAGSAGAGHSKAPHSKAVTASMIDSRKAAATLLSGNSASNTDDSNLQQQFERRQSCCCGTQHTKVQHCSGCKHWMPALVQQLRHHLAQSV